MNPLYVLQNPGMSAFLQNLIMQKVHQKIAEEARIFGIVEEKRRVDEYMNKRLTVPNTPTPKEKKRVYPGAISLMGSGFEDLYDALDSSTIRKR